MMFGISMRGFLAPLLLACGIAAPAQASTVLDFGNTSGQVELGTTGTYGNVRPYTLMVAGQAVNVQVSGWRLNGSTITNAFVGAYSGWGLGVTNRAENGWVPGHAVDDFNGLDFITMRFDQAVILDQIGLKAVSGNDTDARIRFGTATGAFGTGLGLHNANFSALTGMLDPTGFDSLGGSSSRTGTFNPTGLAGNLWVVSPYTGDGSHKYDYFKLKSVAVPLPAPAVPEPGTWLMMLIGFFATGAAMRHRPARQAALA